VGRVEEEGEGVYAIFMVLWVIWSPCVMYSQRVMYKLTNFDLVPWVDGDVVLQSCEGPD
jgi:hypothetical protein